MKLDELALQYDLNINWSYFVKAFVAFVPFAAKTCSTAPREGIDSCASIHSIIGDGTVWQNNR